MCNHVGEENRAVPYGESSFLGPCICMGPLEAGKWHPDFLSPINHVENSKSLMGPRGKLQRKNARIAIMYGKRTLSVNPKAIFKYLSVMGC